MTDSTGRDRLQALLDPVIVARAGKAEAFGIVHHYRSVSGDHVSTYGCEVVGDQAFTKPGKDGEPVPAGVQDWLFDRYREIPDGAFVRVNVEVIHARCPRCGGAPHDAYDCEAP